VYLVGAGPGDPGLITVKGLECIRAADVIVYDHLVDQRLLAEARRDAEFVYVGKSSVSHTMSQAEVNRLLVKKARGGRMVVRLKGGDPFVFGRGGEEAEALASAGVPFEVVPGVSAAVAVPAYAGIPVTHRALSSSFAVITGHETPGKAESSIAWDHLATGVDTLVFLMGVANLGYIVEQLLKNGRPAGTPVAVICEGTLPSQRTVTGTLGGIVDKAREAGVTPPAVLVVGEVVALREKLGWFDRRPLFGKRVLVTRARGQASRLSRMLEEQGAQAIELPAIEIEAVAENPDLDRAVRGITGYDWVFFTSANAVDIFLQRLFALGGSNRDFEKARVGAIGPATAAALSRHGLRADYVPRRFVVEGILEDINPADVGDKRVLLPRADIARPELARGLERLGARVDGVVVYRTVPARGGNESRQVGMRMLREGAIDMVTFTSSSTVRNLVELLGDSIRYLDGVLVACIGPVTADTARELRVRVDIVAGEHTITGLVQALVAHISSIRKDASLSPGERGSG
ncbi:MAG: uroporphyrinogen-III C-methyltransferase, partial [Chloroflexota bacterium]